MYDGSYIIFYNKDLTDDETWKNKNMLAVELGEVFGIYNHISLDNYMYCNAIYAVLYRKDVLVSNHNTVHPIKDTQRHIKDNTRIINYCRKGDLKKEILGVSEAVTMFMQGEEEEECVVEKPVKHCTSLHAQTSYVFIMTMVAFTCFATLEQHILSAILYMMFAIREVYAILTYEVNYGE